MDSILTVTTPAEDFSLLTTEELRTATGAGDDVDDEALDTLGLRVSAVIARACLVATGGVSPPTLRMETLTETFRPSNWQCTDRLRLSRKPIVSVTSVTENGIALSASDYEIDASAGVLRRLVSDASADWSTNKTVVVYVAGWDDVPEDLKLQASKLARVFYSEGTRDPNLRSVEVPGVISKTFWVGPSDDPLLPAEIAQGLLPYVIMWGP